MNLILTLRTEAVCLVMLLLLLWYSSVHDFYDNMKRFKLLNQMALGHVLFDIVTVITVNNQDKVDPLVNRVCHEIFYMFAILFCYVLLILVLDMCLEQDKTRIPVRVLGIIPAGYIISMSFLPIEYIEGNGTCYSFGPVVFAGYGCAILLFVISLIILLTHLKRLSSHDRGMLIMAFVLMIAAVGAQLQIPEMLFTGAGVTMATAAIFMGIVDPVDKFRHKAYHDHMTGLRNRNCYDDDIESLRNQIGTEADKHGLIFVACDLNGLKQINDEFGHSAGDDYIVHAAKSMVGSLKGAKAVYRVGGDEFSAIYLNRSEDLVISEIDKLNKTFESGSDAETLKDVTMPFSLSVAYAVAQEGEDILETAKRADSLIMEEKRKYYQKSGMDRRRRSR